MLVTWASPRTRVSPRVSVVLPAPESPTMPITIERATPPSPDLRARNAEPLVAAAVEQKRRAGVRTRILDAAEEERMVAAPVGALDARDEVGERAVDERGVAHQVEARLGETLSLTAG